MAETVDLLNRASTLISRLGSLESLHKTYSGQVSELLAEASDLIGRPVTEPAQLETVIERLSTFITEQSEALERELAELGTMLDDLDEWRT